MNGQYLMNRPLHLSYAFKKESKGERHGTPAERLLAAQVSRACARSFGRNLAPCGCSCCLMPCC
jgi:splicing factor 3B subunit 4